MKANRAKDKFHPIRAVAAILLCLGMGLAMTAGPAAAEPGLQPSSQTNGTPYVDRSVGAETSSQPASGSPGQRETAPSAGLLSHRIVATIPLTPGVGLEPSVIAADPRSPLVYIGNAGSRDITIISGTEVLGMVAGLSEGPDWYEIDLLVHPSTGLLYTVETSQDPFLIGQRNITLRVLSTTQVLDTLRLGSCGISHDACGISGAAFQPTTGYLYLLRWVSVEPLGGWEYLTILDGTTCVGQYTFSHTFPLAVDVDPLRGYVYTAAAGWGPGLDQVRVLSGTTLLGTVPISLCYSDLRIEVQPRTGLAYVQSEESNLAILSGTTLLDSLQVGEIADLAAHPGNGYLYISHPATPSVTIVSGTAVLTEVAVISPGGSLEVNPATGLVYLRHPEADFITVLSGTEVVAQIPAAGGDRAIEANPFTGLVYALEGDYAGVVLEGTSRLADLPGAAPQPRMMEEDPKSGRLVLLSSPPALSLIRGQEILATTPLTASVKQMAIHPESGLIYLALSKENAVLVMSGTTLLATVPVSDTPLGIAVQPQNGLVYVPDFSGVLNILSGTTRLFALPLSSGSLGGVAADTQSGLIYVTDPGQDKVHILSGTEVVADIAVEHDPRSVAVDPAWGYTYVEARVGGSQVLQIIQGIHPLTETIDLGPYCWVASMVPSAGGYLYVHKLVGSPTSSPADQVVLVRGKEKVGEWSFPQGTHFTWMESHPSKGYLYLGHAGYGSRLSIGVGPILAYSMTVGGGSWVRAIAVDVEAGRVYVATDHAVAILEEYLPYRFHLPILLKNCLEGGNPSPTEGPPYPTCRPYP